MKVNKENRFFMRKIDNGGDLKFVIYANIDGKQKTLLGYKETRDNGDVYYAGSVKDTQDDFLD